jgi:hypothetical protein
MRHELRDDDMIVAVDACIIGPNVHTAAFSSRSYGYPRRNGASRRTLRMTLFA